ncbi:magnesium transporter MgtE N-terminal domain-containing protein [Catenuloplanes sp. NPDC051500]|uniref:magnesium transporter MgtE N-terminal domain-containing protein n=1 Tax=Catenuloplanes sp. NPDC051500 TaxID=3363959 RepID=UPI0037B234BE
MIRSSPPANGVTLMKGMPPDRLPVVVKELTPADLARLLPVMQGDFRSRVVGMLSEAQLIGVAAKLPPDAAVAVLRALPAERLVPLAGRLPAAVATALYDTLPAKVQPDVLSRMDPRQAQAAVAPHYERAVADALARANAEVLIPHSGPAGILLVPLFGGRVAVAPRHGDDGRVAVRDAEEAAYHHRANAALAITDVPVAEEVRAYCAQARRDGRTLDTAFWGSDRHDSTLKRALVGLFR